MFEFYTSHKICRQELAAWVRNNWRPHSTTSHTKSALKVNAINVIWQTQKPAVEEELKAILGVESLDTNTPGYFEQRTAAAKRVLDRMSEQERTGILALVEERREQGNPPEVQRE
jgi:hypothetical protein